MSSPAARTVAVSQPRLGATPPDIAFVGSQAWLAGCAPTVPARGMRAERVPVAVGADPERPLSVLTAFRPQVTVIFDPPSVPVEVLRGAPGVTLGVLVAGLPDQPAPGIECLDRLVSFVPALTGTQIEGGELWRAIPAPVSDLLFGEVRPLRRAPRAMSIGRSTPHREAMLMPAKHHHDLLQVIHGVFGEELLELLDEYDVGIHVATQPGGGFDPEVPLHLAAGQLLLSDELAPAHGLERNIDYLHVESPDGLVWVLDRLARFPEMHQRIRVRGRLKAEQYRASRVFHRLAHDLLADVSAFGGANPAV
jgi:hypothetical protein